ERRGWGPVVVVEGVAVVDEVLGVVDVGEVVAARRVTGNTDRRRVHRLVVDPFHDGERTGRRRPAGTARRDSRRVDRRVAFIRGDRLGREVHVDRTSAGRVYGGNKGEKESEGEKNRDQPIAKPAHRLASSR